MVRSSYAKGKSSAASNETEVSLLMLVLNCIAAVTKLGPTKFSCPPFFSLIPDTTGRLMDKFVDFVPLPQAYHSMKSLGLRREFLVHFGPRAAACRVKSDCSTDEVVFWVDLIQNQLLRAIDREKIWSRLTTSESIEVMNRELQCTYLTAFKNLRACIVNIIACLNSFGEIANSMLSCSNLCCAFSCKCCLASKNVAETVCKS